MNKCPEIEHQIEEEAYFIWEYRKEHGMTLTTDDLGNLRERTAEDDYFEAEDIILSNLHKRK